MFFNVEILQSVLYFPAVNLRKPFTRYPILGSTLWNVWSYICSRPKQFKKRLFGIHNVTCKIVYSVKAINTFVLATSLGLHRNFSKSLTVIYHLIITIRRLLQSVERCYKPCLLSGFETASWISNVLIPTKEKEEGHWIALFRYKLGILWKRNCMFRGW